MSAWKASKSFKSGAATIAFLDEGIGDPVVLVHGFGGCLQTDWVDTGWTRVLVDAGYRTIALDSPGHGGSTRFFTPQAYGVARMARAVADLLDHAGLRSADLIGYSMGARIVMALAMQEPARVRSAVLMGMGDSLTRRLANIDAIAVVLESPDVKTASELPAGYKAFVDRPLEDRQALAACLRAGRPVYSAADLAGVRLTLLSATGSNDEIGGSAIKLAKLVPGARAFELPGGDHRSVLGSAVCRKAVLDFLSDARAQRSR
jgi:pimeloyl-ACP methyl ester carboxylesterase